MSTVVIAGAGVLGAAIGWRLAEAGHTVTLVDPKPGAKASAGSFAWLNASFAADPVYNRLRHDSLEMWQQMKAQDDSVPVEFPGAILFDQEDFDLDAIAQSQADLGRPHERMDGDAVASREPAIAKPPDDALLMGADGYGDPLAITTWFLKSAKAAGAEVLTGATVDAVIVDDGTVTGAQTSQGVLPCDRVIFAAGVELSTLLKRLNVDFRMDNQPGLLAKTTPGTAKTFGMLATPGVHCWQRPDGGFLIGASFGGDTAGAAAPDKKAAEVLAALKSAVAGTEDCEVQDITVRERPMPADGRPAIGPLGPDGLYVVCTHSGMTLAPVIADMVVAEFKGTPDPRLSPYRPDRAAVTAGAPVSEG